MPVDLQIASILQQKYALTQEDANKIFPLLEEVVKNKREANLSFQNLENCSTIFLRHTLGLLYLTYGNQVDLFLHITDLPSENEVLPNQIKRLKERALSPDDYKNIYNQAIGEA